jgi:hypothetical protein
MLYSLGESRCNRGSKRSALIEDGPQLGRMHPDVWREIVDAQLATRDLRSEVGRRLGPRGNAHVLLSITEDTESSTTEQTPAGGRVFTLYGRRASFNNGRVSEGTDSPTDFRMMRRQSPRARAPFRLFTSMPPSSSRVIRI